MTHKEALSVYWNKNLFVSELLGTFLLVYLIFLSFFLYKKFVNKDNLISLPIIYTLVIFIVVTLTWVWSRFLSPIGVVTYLSPSSVIIEGFIKGIRKEFTGAPLLKGIPYIIGAQLLGSFLATGWLFLSTKLLNWIKPDNEKLENSWTTKLVQKNPRQRFNFKNFLKFDKNYQANFANIVEENPTSLTKDVSKEIFFLMIYLFTVPFVEYIQETRYGVDAFSKLLITMSFILFLLIASKKFGFFNFNLIFTFSILINKIVNRTANKTFLISTAISSLAYIVLSMLGALFYLLVAKNSNLTFTL